MFITGGIALLGIQYLLVQGLFDTAIDSVAGCVGDDGTGLTVVTGEEIIGEPCGAMNFLPREAEVEARADDASVIIEQTTLLSQEILSGLLFWSVVTLAVFTVVAVVAASWLSKRSFVRIGQITDTTRRITRHDLHQRLNLQGPADEIKELGDTIDTMLDGLEDSFTQQERFITNASHELRTPLTTSRTALEIPLEQGRVPEHLEPAIRRALDANERSEQLITTLLRLARITAITPDAAQRSVSVPAIIERIIKAHEADIADARLTVTTHIMDSAIDCADPTLLALAVDNLINNAIRHNYKDGALRIASGATNGRLWIEISNTGPSMTEEESSRLIEPFNRGRSTRSASGERSLGLGLTLVQNITESLGGTLILSPRPGGGLIARLNL